MTTQEKREQVIQNIADQLRCNSFTFEFKIVKKPQGIKVIREVTQEELNALLKAAKGGEE